MAGQQEDVDAAAGKAADQEFGGGNGAGSEGGVGADVQPPSGETDFDDKLELEVAILAVSAVRQIAADIAARVKEWACEDAASTLVILAEETLTAKIVDWQMCSTRIGLLEEAMEALVQERQAAGDRVESLSLTALGSAGAAIEGIAHLLSFFRADTEYAGRQVTLDNTALYPAIAGQLIGQGIEPIVVGGGAAFGAPAAGSQTLIARLERLLRLKTRLEAYLPDDAESDIGDEPGGGGAGAGKDEDGAGGQGLEEGNGGGRQGAGASGGDTRHSAEEAAASKRGAALSKENTRGALLRPTPSKGLEQKAGGRDETNETPSGPDRQARLLVGAVDKMLAELISEGEGKASVAELQAASEIAGLIDREPRVCLLTPRILKLGGHYRTRKHLFTTLFTGDQLSYSGGAAVSFVLTNLKTMRVVASDVLYHATGNVNFPVEVRELQPSNLGGEPRRIQHERLEALPSESVPQSERLVGSDNESLPSPNAGDDEAAEDTTRMRTQPPGSEAVPRWREAKSLVRLRAQVDAMAPRRSRASDGMIGDAAHRGRNSDHNPWVEDGGVGVVTAFDITNDPRNGCSAEAIAEAIRQSRDNRVKYIIWNRRIASSAGVGRSPPWAWRRYAGDNPHTKHLHISVKPEKAAYDSAREWRV